MKLLVFAHIPPPHHGQSYMVKLMLDGFRAGAVTGGRGPTVECFHVNAQLSSNLEDVGRFRIGKFFALLRCCARAVVLRFRHGVHHFYYVPAPGRRTPLLRDWLVMLVCRPFFRRVIFHWQAVGLGEWLTKRAGWFTRRVTLWLLGGADLAIVLSEYNRADAEKLLPRHVAVVGNGIPDPCPDYATRLAPRHAARRRVRQALLRGHDPSAADLAGSGDDHRVVQVLFLALCTREKGLFHALEAVELANRTLEEKGRQIRFRLTVAGAFATNEERVEFDSRSAAMPETDRPRYLGFVSGEAKIAALTMADLFCFPTFYPPEGQPLSLIDAMAYGLPILTTRWRAIPEFFGPGYIGLVEPGSPTRLAMALIEVAHGVDGEKLREDFLRSRLHVRHLESLKEALLGVARPDCQRR
jgi:glycosyltransferase involved in cell wall biosynthesis